MSYIKIDSKKFFYNYNCIKNIINAEKIAIVLKDNAYGHGIVEIAKLANTAGIKHTFVKNSIEALSVASYFKTISILYPFSSKNAQDSTLKEAMQKDNIYICVANLESLKSLPNGAQIELKVDSGMHRNGVAFKDLKEAFLIIKQNGLKLKGIFSHNGYGDEISSEFYTQILTFKEIKKEAIKLCSNFNFEIPRFHSLSSAGALRTGGNGDDLYRFGIALYGYDCTKFLNVKLEPILSLYANKISTLELKKGASIGYGGVSVLAQDCIISTYDIGYGDGFFRLREGMEYFSADGDRILARVSMDCLSAISSRDEICIFNDATALARLFNTIVYEILSHLNSNILRIVV